MLSVKLGGIKYHFFLVFGVARPGIEPRSPDPLANTLPNEPEDLGSFPGWVIPKT